MTALSARAAARERGDGIALIDEQGTCTWSELAREVEARIATMEENGLGAERDARVAIVGHATRDRVIDVLAALELGVTMVMLHPRWTAAERDAVIAETDPALVLGGDAAPHGARAHVASSEHAPAAAILFTSGTTGRARGAVLSRGAFVAAAEASGGRVTLAPGDRWLLCMPIAHVGGLSIVVRCLIARATIVIAGPFDAGRTIATIAQHRPTVMSLVPTMLARLLESGWRRPPGLRAILLGGAACPERILERAIDAGLPIRTTYGLTEACSQVTTSSADVRSIADGAGTPLPGIDVRIGGGDAILVRGPTLFDGWFPIGAHPSPFDAEGWYDTGDLGAIDAAGRLHVHARRTDLIVTGAENVYPAEVEAALERVPGVRAACVFGVDDEVWGQIVAAAIVVDDGAPDDTAIASALGEALAPFKRPRRIARVDAIDVTGAGKIDRRATAARASVMLRSIE